MLSCRTRKRLKEISDNSISLLGRKASMSQVVEVLIDKAFIDRKKLLSREITELRQKLIIMETEWDTINDREKQLRAEGLVRNEIRTQAAENI